MRRHTTVVQQILEKVPTDVALYEQLERFLDRIVYKAPEDFTPFDELAKILQVNIPPPPSCDWQWEVISIFMDKPIEEIKKQFEINSLSS